jgi:hypothetical protein
MNTQTYTTKYEDLFENLGLLMDTTWAGLIVDRLPAYTEIECYVRLDGPKGENITSLEGTIRDIPEWCKSVKTGTRRITTKAGFEFFLDKNTHFIESLHIIKLGGM